MQPSYFMPSPSPPNYEYYPFSDGAVFDIGSQYALIGQGIRNGEVFDRGLYFAFLTYLHAFTGQNYEKLVAVQSAIYAVFPALVYLIGRELHSRALGGSVATLAIFRGINAIAASNWIGSSSPKIMATDFPTAIGTACFVLFVIRWLKAPDRHIRYSLFAGGALGLTILLRTNAFLLLPGILVFALVILVRRNEKKDEKNRRKVQAASVNKNAGRNFRPWKAWVAGSLLLISGMLAATLGWDLRNYANGAPMFFAYFARIQLVLRERYQYPLEEQEPAEPSDSPMVLDGQNRRSAGVLTNAKANIDWTFASWGSSVSEVGSVVPNPCASLSCSLANQFLHNLLTSILIFPTSPQLDNLLQTVRGPTPYWDSKWTGTGFGLLNASFFLVNLLLVALGIAVVWHHGRWASLAPLAIYFVYMASNSFARTSGGRHIVPVDWVITIYFALGALTIVVWLSALFNRKLTSLSSDPRKENLSKSGRLVQPIYILLAIFLIGSLVPISERIFPLRYPSPSALTVPNSENDDQYKLTAAQFGLDADRLETFIQDNSQGRLLVGRALYPRYYRANEVFRDTSGAYRVFDAPQLAFTLIGPMGSQLVFLPSKYVDYFPHASDLIVIACEENGYNIALAVVLIGNPSVIYERLPLSELACST